jgi:hypothetical protein
MGSSRLEELLQELVDQNTTIINKLDDIVAGITEIKDELNWIGEHSFAKRVVDNLDAIEVAILGMGS